MTAVGTQIVAADLVFSKPGVSVAEADRPFFNLGAVTLVMTDFIRSQPELATGNSPLFEIWRLIIDAIADKPGPPPVVGLWNNLLNVRDILTRAHKIVADAKSNFITSLEAKTKLLDMRDELESLNGLSNTLRGQVNGLTSLRTPLNDAIAMMAPAHKSLPVTGWRPRDVAHWSRTGKFFESLRKRAKTAMDPQLDAFAAGVAVAHAGALAGNAFINGAVGGPLRNQFWRSRWIAHRVDTWVWGYYRTQADLLASGSNISFSQSNRVPTPSIVSWANLCGADAQRHFEFGGISATAVMGNIATKTAITPFLPAKVVKLLLDSLGDAHPGGLPPGFDAPGLQSAYAMLWFVTWVQTSPEFLRTIPPDQINWPDNCGARPSWAAPDGSIVVGGASMPPPSPAIGNPNKPKLASAIAAALLAIANFLMGNIGGGIEALGAALALLDAGTPPNWDQLDCDLAWTDTYIIALENAFRGLLVAAGVAPPYTVELQHKEQVAALSADPIKDPDINPTDAALGTCWSPSHEEKSDEYPHGPWIAGGPSKWREYPTEPRETPGTISWRSSVPWPNAFMDGFSVTSNGAVPPVFTTTQINAVKSMPGSPKPVIFDGAEWELRMTRAEAGGDPGFEPFGNAVDLALAIIASPPDSLLDWDLDGDRGVGWPTWVWPDPLATIGPVKRE